MASEERPRASRAASCAHASHAASGAPGTGGGASSSSIDPYWRVHCQSWADLADEHLQTCTRQSISPKMRDGRCCQWLFAKGKCTFGEHCVYVHSKCEGHLVSQKLETSKSCQFGEMGFSHACPNGKPKAAAGTRQPAAQKLSLEKLLPKANQTAAMPLVEEAAASTRFW